MNVCAAFSSASCPLRHDPSRFDHEKIKPAVIDSAAIRAFDIRRKLSMNVRSELKSTAQLVKAPLVVGLALALGGGFPWSAGAAASTASVFDQGTPPAVRNAMRFGEQREALNRQLQMRGGEPSRAPNRPATVIPVSNCDDSGTGSLREAFANAVSGDVIDLSSLS